MAKEHSRPTMADVAKEAGVALGTVSRVVNGEPVGDIFREKVQTAIRKLGYQYNSSGRILRTDQTNTIAFIIPNTINPYYALLVNYVNYALEKRDYRMMLCFSEFDRKRESEFIQMAQQNRVDGIIALTYNPELSIPDGLPFVTIDRFFSVSVPCISADNTGGGALAVRKLQEFGCRKLAFLRKGSLLVNEPGKRKDGFVSACVELGLPFECLSLDENQPYTEIEQFLDGHMSERQLDFDGLFVDSDSLAWQVICSLQKMGVRIPEEVQVIGFDGIRMFGNQAYVVSTIVQPVQEIAETCVSTVLSEHLASVPSLITLPVTYAYGGTTKA